MKSAEVRLASDDAVEVRVMCDASPRLVRPRVLEALSTAAATRGLEERTYARGIWTWESR
ncbi:MAG: hypothetical protein AAF211_26790 [Myxococcota bacterium]